MPVGDAAGARRDRRHHRRETLARCGARAQLGEPHLRGGVHERDRVVGCEEHHAGGLLAFLPIHGQRREQHRSPQAFGDVARQRRHDVRVGGGEGHPVRCAQQRESAPRGRLADQRGAQLVAEPVRALEIAVAHAAVEVTAGGLAQARGRSLHPCERGELVEVVLAQLDLGHARPRRVGQPVLDHLAGRQERGRVHREQAEPSNGTARRRMRVAPSVKSRTSGPRCSSRTRSPRARSGETTAIHRLCHRADLAKPPRSDSRHANERDGPRLTTLRCAWRGFS